MKLLTSAMLALLLLSVPVAASSLDVDTGTYNQAEPTIAWWSAAVYLNDAGEIGVGVAMGNSVALWDSYNYRVRQAGGTVYGGTWSYNGEYDGGWSICYSTSAAAQTFDRYAQSFGNSSCNGQPPSPPPPLVSSHATRIRTAATVKGLVIPAGTLRCSSISARARTS